MADLDNPDPEETWQALRDAFWISNTPQPLAHYVYAIFAPWCPYCKQAQPILSSIEDVQFRIIACDARSTRDEGKIVSSALDGSAQASAQLYADGGHSTGEQDVARLILDVNGWAAQLAANIARQRTGHFGYPGYVFRAKDGIRVLSGPATLEAITEMVSSLAPDESGYAAGSRGRELVDKVKFRAFSPRGCFAKKTNTPIFASPLAGSAIVRRFDKGNGSQAVGELTAAGQRWVVMQIYTDGGPYAYARPGDVYLQ